MDFQQRVFHFITQ